MGTGNSGDSAWGIVAVRGADTMGSWDDGGTAEMSAASLEWQNVWLRVRSDNLATNDVCLGRNEGNNGCKDLNCVKNTKNCLYYLHAEMSDQSAANSEIYNINRFETLTA